MEMAKLQEVDVMGRPRPMAAVEDENFEEAKELGASAVAPLGDFLAQLESLLDKKMNAQSAGMHKEMKA